jgi:sulfite exporter TauE/SafE
MMLKWMSSRTYISAAVVIGLACVVLGLAVLQKGGRQKIAQRQKDLEDQVVKVTEPMTSSIRNFNPVAPPRARESR